MRRLLLKSMILGATVTQADLQYVGSITIDEDLMEKADLVENEHVLVVDHTNGKRLETYVIKGPRGTGAICMNGAAAHLAAAGDRVDIMAFRLSPGGVDPVLVEVNGANGFMRYLDIEDL
jgi:aspartate 1-decarboxylase